jgi:PAS domain S-box-containing protein
MKNPFENRTSRVQKRFRFLPQWLRDLVNPAYHPVSAWVVFAISLVITAAAWKVAENYVENSARNRFLFETEDIRTAISKRMQDQEEALRGGVGLFAANNDVTRAEWQRFVTALRIEEYYPGLQGFGFSVRLEPHELAEHQAKVRAEGFPDYEVKPNTVSRETYTSIVFLEPFDWRNKRAFGFDMFSEPTRRAAMERARDTGEPSVTSAVTLVQETDEDIQHGFLMYLPVYRSGAPHGTVDERREALLGYVYSPFRMNDLMQGILGAGNANVSFNIYDGSKPSDNVLLYSTDLTPGEAEGSAAPFERTLSFMTGGHTWTLNFTAHPGYLSLAEQAQPMVIATAGLMIDLMVFFVISSLSRRYAYESSRANKMTEDLYQQTVLTRAIVETAQSSIITLTAHGKIDTLNPAAVETFGHEASELAGRPAVSLLSERAIAENEGRVLSDIADMGLDRKIACIETEGLRADGSTFPMELSVTPMLMRNETVFTLIADDITERRKVEQLKNEFIAVVSHELRTPLTSLVGSLSLINSGHLGHVPEKVGSLVDMALRNGERLSLLVNDILDIEKINSGHMDFNFERLDLASLVGKVIEESGAYGQKRSVGVEFKTDTSEGYVLADASRIAQLLDNLLSNAIKFSPDGSTVTVSLDQEGERFLVAVTDQGLGIAEEMQEKIFEKFQQVDSSDLRQKQGTGLGLAVSQMIAKCHGTRIQVDSKPGQGACFYFDLVEAREEVPDGAIPQPEVA